LKHTAAPAAASWKILGLVMAYAFMCHFNRLSMPAAGTERLMDEYGISPARMGWVYSAYLIAYTIAMTPGGWFIDRFGPKAALVTMGFGSATFVALTGSVGLLGVTVLAWPAFLLIRSAAGLFNAPMHPAGARMVSLWFPPHMCAMGNGLITAAALVGISTTYYLFGAMMDRLGWPAAFAIAGAATAVLALVWMYGASDAPGDLDAALTVAVADPPARDSSRWYALLGDRSLVLLTVSYAAVGYFEYLFFYWMEYYFDKVLELGTDRSRKYSTIATLAMAAGMYAGGHLADRIGRRFGRRAGGAAVPVLGMILSSAFLMAGVFTQRPELVLAWFAIALACIGATEGPFWTMAVELGRSRGGMSAGIFNTGGNAGGLLAPIVTPLFSSYFGWQGGLALASVFAVLGATLWFWIEPAADASPQEKQGDEE